MIRRPPRSTLFPYPTLSRSASRHRQCGFSRIGDEILVHRNALTLEKRVDVIALAQGTLADTSYSFRSSRNHGFRLAHVLPLDRKSTRLNSSHSQISYAVFCL